MESPNEITVRVFKYDGTEYRRWCGSLRQCENSLLIVNAQFDVDVSHQVIGEIPKGTRTIEYYWLDRWYNVFRFLEADGSTRLWYCNVNTPPKFDGTVLSYIDLDIDILVRPDYSYQMMDVEEFEENAVRYGYTDEEKRDAHGAVAELTGMIVRREFPFHFNSSSVRSVVHV